MVEGASVMVLVGDDEPVTALVADVANSDEAGVALGVTVAQ